jgi:hypothetical protein
MFGWKLLFDTLPNKLEPLDYDEFFRTCNPANPDSTQCFIGVTNALTGEAEYLVPHILTEAQQTQYLYAKHSKKENRQS